MTTETKTKENFIHIYAEFRFKTFLKNYLEHENLPKT